MWEQSSVIGDVKPSKQIGHSASQSAPQSASVEAMRLPSSDGELSVPAPGDDLVAPGDDLVETTRRDSVHDIAGSECDDLVAKTEGNDLVETARRDCATFVSIASCPCFATCVSRILESCPPETPTYNSICKVYNSYQSQKVR